jgi:hypothetical protein
VLPPDPDNAPLDPRDEPLAERGRALVVQASAETFAPLALRERIEADRARAAKGGAGRRRRTLLAPVAAVLAAAVVAIVIAGGGAGSPSVLATAALAGGGPEVAAPPVDPSNPKVLRESVEGVKFPEWNTLKWKAVGARHDTLKDRKATTVYYDNPKGARAAYTILAGKHVDEPSKAAKHEYNATEIYSFVRGGRRIVTWQRQGHTCVMSAPLSVPEEKLLALASWRGDGDVAF